ncbi:MAG: PhnD/SsuA/transferrin family substrate-binding protein [Gammaproteobacteria bacterium]|nr:PhnD/SsuA/transferrin family substrate-binding protein [Gammaproteobacteria bacterium]
MRVLALVCLMGQMIPVAVAQQTAIRFGSVAMDIPAVMHKRLTPLTQYLSQELGQPVSLKLAKDMRGAIRDVALGRVDVAYLTPVAYLESHQLGQTQLVAKTVTEGQGSFKLMIVVRADSPIHSIADLRGKSFAFGDRAALLQRAVVVGAGVSLSSLGTYDFLGHYDNIVRAVMRGEYDAGIVKDTMAYKWRGKGIRILYASEALPPYNITASRHVSAAMLKKLKAAFLKLDPKNPEHMRIIKTLDKNYDGFAATSDQEYDIVRQLIAPFHNNSPDPQ